MALSIEEAIQFSPAAERNKDPIVKVLKSYIKPNTQCLEIASGSGQHIVHCATNFLDTVWVPTDIEGTSLQSTQARIAQAGCFNITQPEILDVCKTPWLNGGSFDYILNINMIHIAPREACPALFKGAARMLKPEGLLFLYGPFLFKDGSSAPTNMEFDKSLRRMNEDFGVWYLEVVLEIAKEAGFTLHASHIMPANNFFYVFKK